MQAEKAVELRKAFAAFLGEERFRKFVATGWPLRFWQEQEWRRFSSTHPEPAPGLDVLQVAIRICELHGDELHPDQVELFHGCRDYAPDYIETRNRLFPHAANDPVSTEGSPMQGDHVAVWFCPSCRAAKQRWNARREERWKASRKQGEGNGSGIESAESSSPAAARGALTGCLSLHSLWRRARGRGTVMLGDWPVDRPTDWVGRQSLPGL